MRTIYEIGPLRLDAESRVLTHAGMPVALGARAVAVLAVLVARANEHVPKSEIMDAAWPGLVVEEANLAVQISAIRRALAGVGGESWIETLARRGYRFVGPAVVVSGRQAEPLVATDRARTNLPQALTSFVGRERDIAEIKRLLPATRLLTLTGTGGIGKTRLAVQAAAEVLDAYRDGVWFVDLGPVLDPALVPSALAQVLGVKETSGKPLLETLCSYLRGKQLLVLLDNCEHLLGPSAELAASLLRETAHVSVLATSREALHVAAERTYVLDVMPLPDPKADAASIGRSDAVQLFVDRARQHRPRFDLDGPRARAVAQICVRLDGLPLAIELAAARVAVLPVEDIGRLLDQRFRLLTKGSDGALPRQQTLRAMIDWSHELLDQAEQQLFARLSVFAGGWTLGAAEVVGGGDPIGRDDVVYLLIALIEKSLVVADEDGDRYRMLETVREYARDKLAASDVADAVRERHRDYFLALAEEADTKLSGGEQAEWLQRLDTEDDNLRAALDWSLKEPPTQGRERLCGALLHFWLTRGHLTEGRGWCGRALGAEEGERTAGRARLLNTMGSLTLWQGDLAAAKELHEQAYAIARELGDAKEISASLQSLGNVAFDKCEYESARTLYEESLAIQRSRGDERGVAYLLHNLGIVAYEQGDYSTARMLTEESLALKRKLGDKGGISFSLNNLGLVAFAVGDYARGRALYTESLAIKRDLGDQRGIANLLNNLGIASMDEGLYDSAKSLYEESLVIKRELGDRLGAANTLDNLGLVALEQGDLTASLNFNTESLTIRREQGSPWGIANSLEGFAALVSALGAHLRAATIWGAAERLRETVNLPLPPNDRPRYDRHVAAGREAFGNDAAFDRAWFEGREMPLEQAIELALRDSTSRQ